MSNLTKEDLNSHMTKIFLISGQNIEENIETTEGVPLLRNEKS